MVFGGRTYKLRQVPSAFVYEGARLYVGAGVLIDPDVFLREVMETGVEGRIWVDPQCGVIEERHKQIDRSDKHLSKVIQTTGTGTGPAMADRVRRVARVARDEPRLRKYLDDVAERVNDAIEKGLNVLIEGTQGTYLSLYHGTYPYVTSKDVTASAACSDVGVGPTRVDEVIIVFKSYLTRVGGGPLEGELSYEEAKRRGWVEYGTVTGRPRRVAPFNFKLARRAVRLNGATQAALTKIDVVYPEAAGVTRFEKLPAEAVRFIEEVEAELGIPVTLVSTGPDAFQIVDRRRG